MSAVVRAQGANVVAADPSDAGSRRRVTRCASPVVRLVSRIWLVVALIALWEWRVRTRPSLFVPRPTEIVSTAREEWFGGPARRLFVSDLFVDNAIPSLWRLSVAFVFASVLGIVGGVWLGRSRRADWFFQPLVRMALATPSVILIPLAIVLLGVNDRMTMFVIFKGAFFPILVNTIDGVRNIDALTLNSARAVGLRRLGLFRLVVVPAASPRIIAGLRVGVGIAVVLMVTSELYASTRGLGYQITAAQRSFRFTEMFAGITLVSLIGVLANALFGAAERRALRWRPVVQQ